MNEQHLKSLQHYCSYSERCHEDVRTKLLELGSRGTDLEEIIAQLITDNFLNEERYAQAYVRGKFKHNQWGRIKIVQQLKFRKISDYAIKKGLKEIDEDEYVATLNKLAQQKIKSVSSGSPFVRYGKTKQYLLQKGYENALIDEQIKPLIFK